MNILHLQGSVQHFSSVISIKTPQNCSDKQLDPGNSALCSVKKACRATSNIKPQHTLSPHLQIVSETMYYMAYMYGLFYFSLPIAVPTRNDKKRQKITYSKSRRHYTVELELIRKSKQLCTGPQYYIMLISIYYYQCSNSCKDKKWQKKKKKKKKKKKSDKKIF